MIDDYPWATYNETYFTVGVFWLKDKSYGGQVRFKTRQQAEDHVNQCKRMGYGKKLPTLDNASEIHLKQISVQQVRIL